MPDDTAQTSADRESRIRQCAYYLWEADGCPDGRDQEYWHRAEAMIAREDVPAPDAAAAVPDATPVAAKKRSTASAKPAPRVNGKAGRAAAAPPSQAAAGAQPSKTKARAQGV